jgi:hypothetical protein
MSELDSLFEAVIGLIFIAVIITTIVPALQQIDFNTGSLLGVALTILMISVVVSIIKEYS